jgi:hypothetical protein
MVLFSIVLFELGCSVIELAPEIKILGDYICGLGANFLKSFLFVLNYCDVLSIFLKLSILLG